MPIMYVYGDMCFVHDWVFDSADKFHTKPRVVAAILRHRCRMGRMEANNGGDEYCGDVERMLKDEGYRLNLTTKRAPSNVQKEYRIEQFVPNIKEWYFRDRSCRSDEYNRAMLADFLMTGVRAAQVFRRLF